MSRDEEIWLLPIKSSSRELTLWMPYRELMQLFSTDRKVKLGSWSRTEASSLESWFPSRLSLFRLSSFDRPKETEEQRQTKWWRLCCGAETTDTQNICIIKVLTVLLTTESADAVVVQGKLLQLQATLQSLHFRDVVVIEGGPAKVYQLIQINQLGNPLAVKVQGCELVKSVRL